MQISVYQTSCGEREKEINLLELKYKKLTIQTLIARLGVAEKLNSKS